MKTWQQRLTDSYSTIRSQNSCHSGSRQRGFNDIFGCYEGEKAGVAGMAVPWLEAAEVMAASPTLYGTGQSPPTKNYCPKCQQKPWLVSLNKGGLAALLTPTHSKLLLSTPPDLASTTLTVTNAASVQACHPISTLTVEANITDVSRRSHHINCGDTGN